MIIGPTPFLYLHDTMKRAGLQDGICDKILLQFLYNREKSQLPGEFLLTLILCCAMMVVLGRFYSPSCFVYGGECMCGRFYVPENSEITMLRKVMENLESRNVTVKTGEVSPGDVAAVIASNRELKPQPFGMLWGYHLPHGRLLFNARSETAAQKAIFADGMAHRRCLIPASHYFEWQDTPDGKAKYAIAPKESSGMLLAGIYRFENNLPVFTVLTRTPSDDIAMIHDRMPVILPREAAADWLNPRYHGEEILSAALTNMKYHELKGVAKRDTLDGYPI